MNDLPTHLVSRRRFCAGAVAVAGLGPAARAVAPFARGPNPRFQLGLAAYSLRQYFGAVKGNVQTPPDGRDPLDMRGFIDYCASLGLPAAELTSYFFPPEVTDAELAETRRHAFLRGVTVSGTAIGNDFTQADDGAQASQVAETKEWIRRAALLGAPHIRVFAGAGKGMGKGEAKERCVGALKECARFAGEHGILLGIENHGGIVAEADDLLDILHKVDSPWVGINLDTGNFHTADPYGDLARCAPFAVNVQVKVEVRPADGKAAPTDYARLAAILRDAHYQGFVILEYEEPDDPYTAIPNHLDALRDALGPDVV